MRIVAHVDMEAFYAAVERSGVLRYESNLITFRCELDRGQPVFARAAFRNPVRMRGNSLTVGQAMRDGEEAARSHRSRGCAAHAVHP